jgi:hypothetical protein
LRSKKPLNGWCAPAQSRCVAKIAAESNVTVLWVDTGTFGWYKAPNRCGLKYLILRELLVSGDNPFLGTTVF